MLIREPQRFQEGIAAYTSAAPNAAVVRAVDALLAADRFDATACRDLIRRDAFPDATRYLNGFCGARGLCAALLDRYSHRLLPFRVARAFGLFPQYGPNVTLDSIRERLTSRCYGASAALALAVLGELDSWRRAGLRVRAAYALGFLCRAFLERAEQ